MLTFKYGGKKGKQYQLEESEDLIVVRTQRGVPLKRLALSHKARTIAERFKSVVRFPAAGVEVLRCDKELGRNEARELLKKESALRFAGRVLTDAKSHAPVLYTENFFVKFEDDVSARECKNILRELGLKIKRELEYARRAFFVGAPEGTGQRVFEIAEGLLKQAPVELCHPELVREMAFRGAFPQQWHLKSTTVNGQRINEHAFVESAWSMNQGEGTTIAVIDDGFDLDHEEFASSGKILAPRDVTQGNGNPRPGSQDDHGTACAGVACADGRFGSSGVAPKARLIPIRLASGLGSQAEADAFIWAAEHGADVISCSWGPRDGRWWDPNDPLHNQFVPLPDSTRLAINAVTGNGRNGKGCVITWAAGNGNESVDNDGYASYEKVTAVAACNDSGKRSAYSDKGQAIWCAFPSNDVVDARTSGIWTTDRSGNPGYNPGNPSAGDASGNYTNSFGGTSSACPGAAGVAALVIAQNPELRWDEVKEILKQSCDKIDPDGGQYNGEGHSPSYGYGRLNAKKAVALALPKQPRYESVHTAIQDVTVKDMQTSSLAVAVGDTKSLKDIKVSVDIEHTYIGDLIVRLIPPNALGANAVILHDKKGGGNKDLKTTYDKVNVPALADLVGKSPQGQWTLEVEDTARQDQGKIRNFSVRLAF